MTIRRSRRRATRPVDTTTESPESVAETDALDELPDDNDYEETAFRAEHAEDFRSGGTLAWIGPED